MSANPKLANTADSAEFCREQFCLFRPLFAFKGKVKQKRIYTVGVLYNPKPKFFVRFVKKIRICLRKRIFKKDHFSLFITSRAQMASIHEIKKNGKKSRDTAPLRTK